MLSQHNNVNRKTLKMTKSKETDENEKSPKSRRIIRLQQADHKIRRS